MKDRNPIIWIIALVSIVVITQSISHGLDRYIELQNTPTLTGEYGQPDGRENLTGPYVE